MKNNTSAPCPPLRVGLLLLALLIAGVGALLPSPTQAARTRCFPETGHCVTGAILNYWERNGGLPVFGYPITDQQIETVEGTWTGPVQWFQRDRLEDHGAEGVLAGRLGARYLDLIGSIYNYGSGRPTPPGCRTFPVTGHDVCGRFLQYWERNGGLERFGYPITQEFETLIEGRSYTVQYFERRRMEYHPENAGTRYEVLLGLLGRDIRDITNCRASVYPLLQARLIYYRDTYGCPSEWHEGITVAIQVFERGWMIWAPGVNGQNLIFVIYRSGDDGGLAWQVFPDTWDPSQPSGGDEAAPPGFVAPVRGFGKVWRNNQGVRDALGWAYAPEQSQTGAVLSFENGAWMVYITSPQAVFVLHPGGVTTYEMYPR